jgi:choline dehydrogenase-like flavoprotein
MSDLLSAGQRRVLARVCELLVPGSAVIRPDEYIARVLTGMRPDEEDAVHAAIGVTASVTDTSALAGLVGTSAFELVRRLAVEAYYGDFAPAGHTGPTGHDVIGFAPPQARRLRKDWSFLGEPVSSPSAWDPAHAEPPAGADVVVVGSGAGGGVIAAELAERGADVLLVEAGGLHPATEHTRFELAARHQLWWPTRFAATGEDGREPVALLGGRCVGGSTVINTKVAMRATESDVAKFHRETGLLGAGDAPLRLADLLPWYERIERALGVRARADWTASVHRVHKGFVARGATLQPVRSYTDFNCFRCGACLQGCPTNAGRSTLNTFLAPMLATGALRLLTRHTVHRLLLDLGGSRPAVRGVTCVGADGTRSTIETRTVVLAAGALNTPQILLRSEDFTALDTPSTRLVGQTLGLHPARLVYGRFDEPQDCHLAYPITAHCLDRQHDRDGGVVLEATTIQDPVSFAESLVDDQQRPLWGARLVDVVRDYRYWAGVLAMSTDENTARIELDANEEVVVTKRFSTVERARLVEARAFATDVLLAAGAREVVRGGLSTTHMQGSVRMGSDPNRSVVDATGRAHDVTGLYVGDSSLVPASLSVNPSLTVMALAAKVAAHITEERSR